MTAIHAATRSGRRYGKPGTTRPVAMLVAVALGAFGGVSAFVLGIPGNGAFVPVTWLLAFLTVLLARPGSVVPFLAGLATSTALLDLSDGAFALIALAVAIPMVIAVHGALCAAVVLGVRRLGLRASITDPWVGALFTVVMLVALAMTWFAIEFAHGGA